MKAIKTTTYTLTEKEISELIIERLRIKHPQAKMDYVSYDMYHPSAGDGDGTLSPTFRLRGCNVQVKEEEDV